MHRMFVLQEMTYLGDEQDSRCRPAIEDFIPAEVLSNTPLPEIQEFLFGIAPFLEILPVLRIPLIFAQRYELPFLVHLAFRASVPRW